MLLVDVNIPSDCRSIIKPRLLSSSNTNSHSGGWQVGRSYHWRGISRARVSLLQFLGRLHREFFFLNSNPA